MRTPQVKPLPGMTPLGVLNPLSQDEAEIARRLAAAPLKAARSQEPCDVGLFSDAAQQADLVDMATSLARVPR